MAYRRTSHKRGRRHARDPMAKGSYTNCPECGQRTLRQNLKAHLRKVHEKRPAGPKPTSRTRAPRPRKSNAVLWALISIVAVATVGAAYYVAVVNPFGPGGDGGTPSGNPIVVMRTNYGDIRIELDQAQAPATVANFLSHVDPGHYDNTPIHRVAANFVIQGGQLSVTAGEVDWERTGLLNSRGTISMARVGGDPNSGTSQFFINLKDNSNLDTPGGADTGYPYVVFGRVVEGMGVVDTIGAIPTNPAGDGQPNSPVTVISVTRV